MPQMAEKTSPDVPPNCAEVPKKGWVCMIYDTFENLEKYLGLSRSMDAALRFLKETDLAALPVGRHEIDGANVYANVSDTKYVEEGRWEAHKKYADIQVNLDGGELSGCRPTALTADWAPYNAEKDAMMSDDPRPGFRVPLAPGCFAVFFPQDAHMPCLSDGTRSHGRKVVVKVRVD